MNSLQGLTVECQIHFERKPRGRKKIADGAPPKPASPARIPRVARLMALAIKFESLIRSGHIDSYSDMATLGHITRARATQIMNLLTLAPDIQEEILHLPPSRKGDDPVTEHHLRKLTKVVQWNHQRAMWREVKQTGQ